MTKKRKKDNKKGIETLMQLSNFLIKKRGDGEFTFVRITCSDPSWAMEFREDTFKYAWILMLMAEEKYHGILESWITMSYHMTNANPDPAFLESCLRELESLNQRTLELMDTVAEEG